MTLNTTAQYVYYLYNTGAITSSDRVSVIEVSGVAGLVPLQVTACERAESRVVFQLSSFGKLSVHESDTVTLAINE